jgi:hypothetical protein
MTTCKGTTMMDTYVFNTPDQVTLKKPTRQEHLELLVKPWQENEMYRRINIDIIRRPKDVENWFPEETWPDKLVLKIYQTIIPLPNELVNGLL